MVTAIMWPIQYPRMSGVSPVTYSESLTFQEMLYIIKAKVDEIVTFTETLSVAVNTITEGLEANRLAILKETDEKIAAFRKEMEITVFELKNLIAEVSIGGSAYDPTDGTDHKPVSEVLERIYDHLRTAAEFAGNSDSLERTAGELDGRSLTARQLDLDPQKVTNHATREQ